MKRRTKKDNSRGFTLIEMLIVLVMVSVLLAIAATGLRDVQKRNRIETTAHALFTSLMLTRTEAIKRNSEVIMCKSNNGAACTNSAEWHEGWLVYADADGDSFVDPNEVLRVGSALGNGDTLYTSGGSFSDQIVYTVDGSASGAGRFVLCSEGDSLEFAKEVSISITGRPKLNSGTSDCTP